jgi:hypothetical protein
MVAHNNGPKGKILNLNGIKTFFLVLKLVILGAVSYIEYMYTYIYIICIQIKC